MSSRSYLSIGDVLTLLRQEFPDVTISKIRFLESQGLVNPERTPSGYRKFYEHDVERLRWVLRQQREHFLPLKVIKDRLDEDNGAPADAVAERVEADAAATGRVGTGTTDDRAPVEAATPSPSGAGATVTTSTATSTSPVEPVVSGPTAGAPRLVAVPDPVPSGGEQPDVPEVEPAARHRAPARASVGAAAGRGPSAASGRTHRPRGRRSRRGRRGQRAGQRVDGAGRAQRLRGQAVQALPTGVSHSGSRPRRRHRRGRDRRRPVTVAPPGTVPPPCRWDRRAGRRCPWRTCARRVG